MVNERHPSLDRLTNLIRHFWKKIGLPHSVDLTKKISVFAIWNIVAMGFNMVVQLVLSKGMSQYDFGFYKTLTLYLHYAGLLHFGFKDAIYIDLCEQKKNPQILKEVREHFSYYIIQQFIVMAIFFLISFIIRSSEWSSFFIILGLMSFFSNLGSFYDSYLQAFKRFKDVIFVRITKVLPFLFLILILWINRVLTFMNCSIMLVTSSVFWAVIIFIYFRKSLRPSIIKFNPFNPKYFKKYTYGFMFLMGNFSFLLFNNLDKNFVSAAFPKEEFAIYSFGAMFFSVFTIMTSSISNVFTPYLFNDYINNLKPTYSRVERLLCNSFFLMIPFYWIIYGLVSYYYSPYKKSLLIFQILMFAIFFNSIVMLLHNNYYRVLRLEKYYMVNNWLFIGVIIIFMSIALILHSRNILIFAIITSFFAWIRFLYNEFFLRRKLGINLKGLFGIHLKIAVIGLIVFFSKF